MHIFGPLLSEALNTVAKCTGKVVQTRPSVLQCLPNPQPCLRPLKPWAGGPAVETSERRDLTLGPGTQIHCHSFVIWEPRKRLLYSETEMGEIAMPARSKGKARCPGPALWGICVHTFLTPCSPVSTGKVGGSPCVTSLRGPVFVCMEPTLLGAYLNAEAQKGRLPGGALAIQLPSPSMCVISRTHRSQLWGSGYKATAGPPTPLPFTGRSTSIRPDWARF